MLEHEPALQKVRRRRRRPRPSSVSVIRLALGLFGVTLIGSALSIGSVHPESLVIASCVTTLLLCGSIAARQGLTVPPLAMLLAFLAGLSLLQVLPLPALWLDAVGPNNAAIWQQSSLPGAAPPELASVSVAPPASGLVALRLWVYACVATSATLLTKEAGPQVCLSLVFASTVVIALVTLLHAALDLESVYGIYTPRHATDTWPLGPLLNPNNLAGYLNLGILIGIGLLATEDRILPTWLVVAGVLTNAVMCLLTASRAGVLCLVLSTAALCWVLWRRAASRGRFEVRRAVQVATVSLSLVVFGLVLGGSLATESTWAGLFDKELEKLSLLLRSTVLVRDHLWVGIGAGAFETAYAGYSVAPGNALFPSAENLALDWLASWGVPMGGAGLLVLVWQLIPTRLGIALASPSIVGAYAGILAVLAQNMLDLALDVPAVGLALFATVGVVTATLGVRIQVRSWARRIVTASIAATGLALAAVGFWFGRPSADQTRQALDRQLESGETLDSALAAALRRYPADPYLPLLGAINAVRQGRNSMVWLNRALTRDPRNPSAHFAAAQILKAHGATGQALLHLRHAVTNDAALLQPAARWVVSWTLAHDDLAKTIPFGPNGPKMWVHIAQNLGRPEQGNAKASALLAAIQLDPNLMAPRSELLSLYLNALSHDYPLCADDQRHCIEQAEAQTRKLLQLDPKNPSALLGEARLLYHTQGPERAAAWLSEHCNDLRAGLRCHLLRLQFLTESGKMTERKDAEERLRTACVSESECGQAEVWIAQSRLSRGDSLGAMAALERATKLMPSRENWQLLANAARRAGKKGVEQLAQTRADTLKTKPAGTR